VKRFLVMLTLLLMVIPSVAQDKTQNKDNLIDLGGGYQLALPRTWTTPTPNIEITYPVDDKFDSVVLVDVLFATQAVIISPAALADVFDGQEKLSFEDAYILAMAEIYDFEVSSPDLEPAGLENYEGMVLKYTNSNDDGTVIFGGTYIIEVDDSGSYLVADVYSDGDDFLDENERVVELLDAVIAPESTATDSGDSQAQGEPCFVSTETARTATVRVGPGTNRTALLFLPVGDEFSVTGRLVTDDETVWYQLDKTEVDPTTSAAELWVAQADVDEAGDCALVGETSAPPIRPIIPSAPPAGSTDGSGATVPAGGTIPQSGTWTLVLAERGLVSCLGTNTVEFETDQIFISRVFTDNLSVAGGGASFTFLEFTFVKTAQGAYSGAIALDSNGASYGVKFYVQNTGFMSGETVFNENVQGLACSFTIPLTASRG